MPNSQTIKKLEYNDIRQFIEDINHNFAIIQNSPFFKGVPGKRGLQGIRGIDGERGIKFFIVKFADFEKKFPGKYKNPNNINLVEINKLLENHNNKIKLLEIFSIKDFVQGDIILLENTKMLQLDGDKFVDTNISLGNTEILQDVQSQIERILVNYLERDTLVQIFKNVFFQYESHAKNYADTSNKPPISTITPKTIFEPHTGDYKSGIKLEDHKFIAIDKNLFGVDGNINSKTTTILGNLKRFIQLSQNTINESVDKSFSSDYGIGMNNLPSLVVMQNDYNSGILIGSKDFLNLGKFSKIFTNEIGDLVLQNQTSPNLAEINRLRLTQSSLITDKNLLTNGSLEVSGDTILNNSLRHQFFRSGSYLQIPNNVNSLVNNQHWFELGNIDNNSVIHLLSKLRINNFSDKVLVTDNNGFVVNAWEILKNNVDFGSGLNTISQEQINRVSETNKIVTASHYGKLVAKVMDIANFVRNNYYTKSDFANPAYIIPNLFLRERLSIQNQFEVFNNTTTINTNTTNFLKDRIAFNQFRNKVLVTDGNGFLRNNFFVDLNYQNGTVSNTGQSYNENSILTGKHFTDLAHRIIRLIENLNNNYWSKTEWDTWNLPKNLWIQNLAASHTLRVSRPDNEQYPVLKADYDSKSIEFNKIERFHLGTGPSNTYSGPLVFINSHIDKERNGKLDTYHSDAVYANADTLFTNTDKSRTDVRAMVGKHLELLLLRFNAIRNKFNNYFTKIELQNHSATLWLNSLTSKAFELLHNSTVNVWWNNNVLKFLNNASISLSHTNPGDVVVVREDGTLGGSKSIYVKGMVCAFYVGTKQRELELNALGWYRCTGATHNGFKTPKIDKKAVIKNSLDVTLDNKEDGHRTINLSKSQIPAHEHDVVCFSAGEHNHRTSDSNSNGAKGLSQLGSRNTPGSIDNDTGTHKEHNVFDVFALQNDGAHTHDILVFGGGNDREYGDDINIEPFGTYLTYMCYCG